MKIKIAINTNIRAFNHTPNDNPMTGKMMDLDTYKSNLFILAST